MSYNASLFKKYNKCSICKKNRIPSVHVNHWICRSCSYNARSGNKVIDNFIKYTQRNIFYKRASMKFVPHDQFENIEFIAEGGFSKIYKATWIGGESKIYDNLQLTGDGDVVVVLKKLNNSKNITSKELNEVCTMLYTSN